jgi:hypothetical protein
MLLLPIAVALCATAIARACPWDEEVQVTVVSILATEKNTKVDKELVGLAKKIQERKPNLTGFKIDTQSRETLLVGKEREFQFVDKQKAFVTVRAGADADNKVRLKVKLPCLGEVCYTTCCGKFFPIATCYKTKKNGDCLIIAVMVEPCTEK